VWTTRKNEWCHVVLARYIEEPEGPAMNSETLAKRRHQLEHQCELEKLNWKERIKGLPTDDDGVIVAALSTLLKFRLRAAFEPSKSLTELDRERKTSEAEAKKLDDFRRRLAP
jgi:hypothetical protein